MVTPGVAVAFRLAMLRPWARDAFKMALYGQGANISGRTPAYTPEGELPDDDGYTAGGLELPNVRVQLDGDVAILTADAVVWRDSKIRAWGALIYDATRDGMAITTYDLTGEDGADVGPDDPIRDHVRL